MARPIKPLLLAAVLVTLAGCHSVASNTPAPGPSAAAQAAGAAASDNRIPPEKRAALSQVMAQQQAAAQQMGERMKAAPHPK